MITLAIDCREKQLMQVDHQIQYLALSYVWGKEYEDETIPTIGSLPEGLPKLIQDDQGHNQAGLPLFMGRQILHAPE